MLLLAPALYAADSPGSVASTYVEALEENDWEKIETLIYPASLAWYKEGKPDLYARQMGRRLSRKKPSQYLAYEILIEDIEEDEDYDRSNMRLRFIGNKWAVYPVAPIKRFVLMTKEEQSGGVLTAPYSVQTLAEHEGQWYIVWPTEYIEIE